MRKNASSQRSVAVAFLRPALLLVVVALFGMGAIGIYLLRTTTLQSNVRLGQAVMNSNRATLSAWIETQIDSLESMADGPSTSTSMMRHEDASAAARIFDLFLSYRDDHRDVAYLALYRRTDEGIMLIHQQPTVSAEDPGVELALVAIESERSVIGDAELGTQGGAVIPVAVPIVVGSRALGSVVAGLRITRFTDRIIAGSPDAAGEPSDPEDFFFLVSENGDILAHPNEELVMSDLGRERASLWISQVEASGLAFDRETDQTSLHVASDYVIGTGASARTWHAFYRVDLSAELSRLWTLSGILIAATAVVAILVALVMVVVARRVVVLPVRELGEQIQTIASGDGDLTSEISVRRNDEIGVVAGNFNEFVQSLRSMIGGIQQTARANQEATVSVEAATAQASSAITQILANITSANSTANHLGTRIDGASDSSRSIGDKMEVISEQTEQQSAAVSESTASVEEMIASLKNVARLTDARSGAAEEIAQHIGESQSLLELSGEAAGDVNEAIESIREMTGIISRIAGQTNLLAMNAAIEAAHAGEYGRGFAVVAQEIRALAEHAAGSSKRIATSVRRIVDSMGRANNATDQLNGQLTSVFGQISLIADTFREIRATTNELSQGSDEIMSAMSVLNASAGSITNTIGEVGDESKRNLEEMRAVLELIETLRGALTEMSIGSDDISGAMGHLEGLSHALGKQGSQLGDAVGRFRVSKSQ